MCEAAAYLYRGGKEELVLESIDLLESKNGKIRLIDIFGEKKEIEARVRSLSLIDHKIILEPL